MPLIELETLTISVVTDDALERLTYSSLAMYGTTNTNCTGASIGFDTVDIYNGTAI